MFQCRRKPKVWNLCHSYSFNCSLSEYLATDPEVPGPIPGAFRFSERQWVWNGVHSASWVQLRSCLEEIVAAPVKKTENTTGGIRCTDHATSSIRKSWYYFAKKRRSLGRHSSLADQSHGVFFNKSIWSRAVEYNRCRNQALFRHFHFSI
jgi:hypothetical protein